MLDVVTSWASFTRNRESFLWVGVIYYPYARTEAAVLLFSVKSIILHFKSNWISDLISCSQWISIPMLAAEDLLCLPRHGSGKGSFHDRQWHTVNYFMRNARGGTSSGKSDLRVNSHKTWSSSLQQGDICYGNGGKDGRMRNVRILLSLIFVNDSFFSINWSKEC